MKERIGSMVSPHLARELWMGTFHSLFARILRREAEVLGFPREFHHLRYHRFKEPGEDHHQGVQPG